MSRQRVPIVEAAVEGTREGILHRSPGMAGQRLLASDFLAIVDCYFPPKHAYFTVKRELAPITIGLKRTVTRAPAAKHTRVNVQTVHSIEVRASNLSLQARPGMLVQVRAWDLETGKEIYSKTLSDVLTLEPDRSVEVAEFELPLRTVVAAYLIGRHGKQVARYVNWPEPLKYPHLQKPKDLNVSISEEEGGYMEISAEVPVKGVALEALEDDDTLVFEDNSVDVVPGEVVRTDVKGVKMSMGFDIRYLN